MRNFVELLQAIALCLLTERQAKMAYEKYNKYVPLSEQLGDGFLIKRVQVNFNAHARVRKDIAEAARKKGMTVNEWLCETVVDALTKEL